MRTAGALAPLRLPRCLAPAAQDRHVKTEEAGECAAALKIVASCLLASAGRTEDRHRKTTRDDAMGIDHAACCYFTSGRGAENDVCPLPKISTVPHALPSPANTIKTTVFSHPCARACVCVWGGGVRACMRACVRVRC